MCVAAPPAGTGLPAHPSHKSQHCLLTENYRFREADFQDKMFRVAAGGLGDNGKVGNCGRTEKRKQDRSISCRGGISQVRVWGRGEMEKSSQFVQNPFY